MRYFDWLKKVFLLQNRSLKTKMALSVSALFVVASTVTTFFAVSYLERELKHSIATQQNVLAKSIADSLDDKLHTAQQALSAASSQIKPAMLADPDRAQLFLDDKRPLQTIFTNNLYLFDPRGVLIAESPFQEGRRGTDFSYREYIQQAAHSRKPFISEPYLSSKGDHQPAIMITVPVYDGQGNLACVLGGSMKLRGDNFLGELPRVRIGKKGYLVLATATGILISHPNTAKIMKPGPPRGVNRLLDRALAGFDGSGDTVNGEGLSLFTSFRHLSATDWILAVNLPAEEAYAVVSQVRRYLVGGIAGGTLVLLAIVWLIMQRLTLPLITISRQVAAMDGVEVLNTLDCPDSSSEIRTLALAFNRLAEMVRQQQETLQQNERKYRIVADNTYDWEFWLSPECRFVYASPSCQRITGYADIDFLADPELLERIIHPEDRAHFLQYWNDSPETKSVRHIECRIVRRDGEIRWVAHLCQPIYDDLGRYLGLRGNNRDITGRKRIEAELLQSEERYRTLVESSPAAVLLHRDGVFIYANDAACRLLGAARPQQLIGTQIMEIVPPAYRELVRERIEAAASTAGRVNPCREEKVLRLDGTLLDVEVVGTHLTYQGLPAVQVIMLDISASKQAKQALKESEETLRNLIEVMPVGVSLMGDDGKVEYINRCFQESFGYTHAEIPTVREWGACAFRDPEYAKKLVHLLDSTLAEALENSTPLAPVEVDVTCKDGSVRHVILNRQLSGTRKIAIFTDITERESLQNELLKAQKLESLGVLAGGIAHDFNNILTGILGNISFARLFLDEAHSSYLPLGHAEKASLRAAELATQLLTFAKGGTPVKKTVSLPPLLEESVSLALRGSNVKGVLHIPDALLAIEADEGQIGQAFHNVILNAAQAMPQGGTLTITARSVTLGSGNREGLPPRDYVMLSFADEGGGVPDEIQQKIFDPYFTTKPGGNGLGLASVHSIVSRHGGRVEVASASGKGTVFTFLLPAVAAVPVLPAAGPGPLAPPGRAGEAVLVMDDEGLILTLTSQILGHLGYLVTTCADGEQAVARYLEASAAGAPFYAAIMDLTVPGGWGGKEAAQRILALDPCARLIVSSGYSNDPVMAEYGRFGFCAAIAKPYKGHDLARVLSGLG